MIQNPLGMQTARSPTGKGFGNVFACFPVRLFSQVTGNPTEHPWEMRGAGGGHTKKLATKKIPVFLSSSP